MKKLLFLPMFILLVLPLSFATTYINKETGKELWFQDKIFNLFAVTAQECSAFDGTTYTNYAGECRKRLNCKPSSDLSVCSCDVSTCDASSPPPTSTDPSLTTCSKSFGSVYINGQKIGTDGCISGFNTKYECKPSSVSGYSLSFSGVYYDVWIDGSCTSGVTSGSVTYTSVPASVVKGNKFTVQANIKLDSIASNDCLQTIEGCRLLFELAPESCPSGSCVSQLKPQSIIPIFSEKSACDESPYWSSTTTIVKSGDTVQGTFTALAPSLLGQYKYKVNVFRGCFDIQLPISSSQISIEIKDGTAPPPETKNFCLSSDKKTCSSRLGSCLNGETTYTSGITCEADILGGGGGGGGSACNADGSVVGTGTFTNPLKCCEGYSLGGGFRKCRKAEKDKSFSLTEEEYLQASAKAIAASACDFGSTCNKREGYSIKCIANDNTRAKNTKAFEQRNSLCHLNKEDISLIGVFKITGYVLGLGYLCKSSTIPEGTCFAVLLEKPPIDTEARQKTVTKNNIEILTSTELIKSSCSDSDMCESNAVCQSLDSLQEEGVITESRKKKDIQEIEKFIDTAFVGAGATLSAVGGYIAGTTAITSGGAVIIGSVCSTIGALTGGVGFPICLGVAAIGGGVAGGLLTKKVVSYFNDLTKKDTSSIGYCVPKEETTTKFSFTKFIESIGKGVNEVFGGKVKTHIENTTMGYIVFLVVIIIIILIIFRRR